MPSAGPDYTHALTSAKDPHLTSPFPELDSDGERGKKEQPTAISASIAPEMTTAATALATTAATAQPPSLEISVSPAVNPLAASAPSTSVPDALASLTHAAHDQALEIINSLQSSARRRRSSVEAVAAASSVLASFASSAKARHANRTEAAAALATAVAAANSPPVLNPQMTYSSGQHSAAAALLAASGLHPGILPTDSGMGDTGIPQFDVASFGALPAYAVEATVGGDPSNTAQTLLTTIAETPTRSAGKPAVAAKPSRRKAAAGEPDLELSMSPPSSQFDGPLTSNGMPLTPDAPGSGRPGSLRHLTPDERRARRLQRNRLAAKECRQKKKVYITNLEQQVEDLENENSRLRKEIEELNAKLTLGGMRTSSTADPALVLNGESPQPKRSRVADRSAAPNPDV
ncbi:hypothetical protein DL89DRAFT_268949 [Linderina pennispora]|uniref:BZIP domain-containing protein n=1 Tax=Linderina pennispora TaxID=61395 RepID=A0A1Y1W374_9FUNG|nr:uncharacterized protein DL89DRAFT_268949 [Linderina pennispora]ORX67736.1 hypothetical protein DL89DRAFT_268949 [Linderina pennispora]